MNYGQLVKRIAKKTKRSQREVDCVLEAALTEIQIEILAGEKVSIRDFGVFGTRWVNPQQRRYVVTGRFIHIPGHRVLKFKPGRTLKEKVKNMNRPKTTTTGSGLGVVGTETTRGEIYG